jgi:hypothetical protein
MKVERLANGEEERKLWISNWSGEIYMKEIKTANGRGKSDENLF